MGTESLLDEYLTKVRAKETAPVTEVRQRVEAAFDELKLPWERSQEGNWAITSDVGEVRAGLDDDEEVLTFWQLIHELGRPPKKAGEYLFALLSANADTTGACFAIREMEGMDPLVFIVSRIAAQKLDPEEVALALQSVFWLSSHFDE